MKVKSAYSTKTTAGLKPSALPREKTLKKVSRIPLGKAEPSLTTRTPQKFR